MDFDKYASKYDISWMGGLSGKFYRNVVKYVKIEDGYSVLDVGCGTGKVLHLISEQYSIEGYGVDVSKDMLKEAKRKYSQYDFKVADCEALPFDDQSMDVIITCMAYHHFSNQSAFRKEALRVLKPSGVLYICDPRFPWIIRFILNSTIKEAGFHSTIKNKKELQSTGFTSIDIHKDIYVQMICAVK